MRGFKSWRWAAGTLLAFLGAWTAWCAQSSSHWTVESVLKQLDTSARNFHSLTADLERTKVTVVVNDKSTESGQIFVRHDDKMRIEMTKPDARTILRAGNELYIYNPKINRVEVYDLGKKQSLVDEYLLLGFGTSGSKLRKSYVIILRGEETMDNRKVVWLELTPLAKEVQNQISKIQMWIDESNWLPVQQKFFETGSEDYFVIHYTNIVRNAKLSDNEFKPRWPKNVLKIKPRG